MERLLVSIGEENMRLQRKFAFLLCFCLSCSNDIASTNTTAESKKSKKTTKEPNKEHIESINISELKIRQTEIKIIDVRSPDEYNLYHIPGAQSVPLGDLENQLENLSGFADESLYLVCATGRRSHRAAKILKARGFSNPINVKGGTEAWKAAGHPLERAQ